MRVTMFCALMAAATMAAGTQAPLHTVRDEDRIEGSYIIVFQDHVDVNEAAEDMKNRLLSRFIPMGTIERQYEYLLKGIAGSFSEEAIEVIRRLPQVKYVEENQVRKIMQYTEPVASWGLDRIDDRNLTDCDGYYNPHFDGAGVHVYVIDTGVWTTHQDFEGRAEHGWDIVDNDDDATDCHGHGTHCAGTVAGKIYGVAKGANIIAVRVLGCLGFGSSADVLAGMEWARVDSVGKTAIVSMSLGGGPSAADDEAVRRLVEDDVFVVVAAGNDGDDACLGSPARAYEAMTVGATDRFDNIASFSNYGMCVNIFAPGVSITSAWFGSDDNENTISGTSMSCPHVAGAAALIRQENPWEHAWDVFTTLQAFATEDCVMGLDDIPEPTVNSLLHVHKKFEV